MMQQSRSDICQPDSGVALGAGWSEVATANDQPYRTVAGDAAFDVADMARSSHIIVMSVEPDDYDTLPALKIASSAGVLADVLVHGRQIVRAMVPKSVVPDRVRITTSATTGAGAAVRVHEIFAHRSFGEVILESEHLRLGANWHPLEIFGGRAFRWAANDVTVFADPGFAAQELVIDLETGPSADETGVTLELRDASGALLGTGHAHGLARLRFDVSRVSAPATLTLVARGGGSSSTSDDERVLNYRVFDISAIQR